MKKPLLTGGIMLAGISLFAQPHHFTPFQKSAPTKQQLLVQSLLNRQTAPSGTAQKPTGMQQRVIAQASINEDMEVEDTATYKYSGTRTSKFNHNSFFEAPAYNWGFTSNYLTGPAGEIAGRSANLQADSIISYDGSTPYSISKAYYRDDNKLDSFFSYEDGGATLYSRNGTKHQFNNTGNLLQYTNLSNVNNITVLDSTEYRKIWYNAAGTQLLKDTTYSFDGTNWKASYATLYFYNTQNNLDSTVELNDDGGVFYVSGSNKIQYDASNRLLKVYGYSYDNTGTSEGGSIFSFAYTGTSPLYTLFEESYIFMNDTFTSVVMKTLGANNLPDTMKYGNYENGVFVQDMAFKYYYNNYNNPDSLIAHDIDGDFAGRFNFYYETYDDGNNVGIKDAKANKNFNIYPNPFDNKINIDWKGTGTQAKISLINMIGQTVYTLNKSLSTGNNTIDIPATAGGNYILVIQDEKGNTYNQKLTKR